MREYKFRGMTINGEWVYGLIAIKDGHYYISNSSGAPFAFEVIPETVGQYTGLNDKNGKEIYEWDKCMVERPCVGAVGTIKFHQGCFIFVENHTGNILRLCDLKLNNYTIKVIGNIFENPELLESEV